MKNFRTNIAALAVLATVGLYYFHYITVEQMSTGIGVLVAAGLLAAKDSKKD